MKVLICAGGTGGGIYPALTAVAALNRHGVTKEKILWIGTQGEMEEKLVPPTGLKLETIQGGAIVGVPPQVMMKNGAKLTWSLGKASRIIRRFKPDVMFMTGGYMSVPVALACRFHRVPVAIFFARCGTRVGYQVRHAPGAKSGLHHRFIPRVCAERKDRRDWLSCASATADGDENG